MPSTTSVSCLPLLVLAALVLLASTASAAPPSGLPICTGTDLCPPDKATSWYYCQSGAAVNGCLPVTLGSSGFAASECSQQCLVANPGFKQCAVDPPCPRQLGTSWYHCQLGGAINGCMQVKSTTKGFPSADCLLQCIFSNPPVPSPPELPTPEEPYVNCTNHQVNSTITPEKCHNETEQICKFVSGVLICKDGHTTEICTPAVYGKVTYCACLELPAGKLLNDTKGACPLPSPPPHPPLPPSPRPPSPKPPTPARVIVCQDKTARQQTGEDCSYEVVHGGCHKDAATGVRICQEDSQQEVCVPVYTTLPICECRYRDNGRIAKTTSGRCI